MQSFHPHKNILYKNYYKLPNNGISGRSDTLEIFYYNLKHTGKIFISISIQGHQEGGQRGQFAPGPQLKGPHIKRE